MKRRELLKLVPAVAVGLCLPVAVSKIFIPKLEKSDLFAVSIQYSDDGGHTWSKPTHEKFIEKPPMTIGLRQAEINKRFNRLYRIKCTEDAFTLVSAHADIDFS